MADSSRPTHPLLIAAALALAAGVSLGLSRFSYALLLPPMRADLGWNYLTAGAMNTVNAAGYLVGALWMPRALRHWGAHGLLLSGALASAVLLGWHGLVLSDASLYALRFATGMSSAATFVAGGLLAARLVGAPPGLVLGIYYGGTGLGIIASAVVVPPLVEMDGTHAWQWAWMALGALALLATGATAFATRGLGGAPGPAGAVPSRFDPRPMACGLASYFLFGLGYIGYMTFAVTLLREQQLSSGVVAAFFGLLGVGTLASSWLWAGLLQRYRGGQPMALLNALLAAATVLPVLSTHPLAVFVSGALFGGVFLQVVASTTALVRHNLPGADWAAGISAFTITFALGQIAGPSLVGGLADGSGGLRRGLAVSAAVLALGAWLAWRQKALPLPLGRVA